MFLLITNATGRYAIHSIKPHLQKGQKTQTLIEPDPAMLKQLQKLTAPHVWEPVEDSKVGKLVPVLKVIEVPTSIKAWQAKAMLKLTTHEVHGDLLSAVDAILNGMTASVETIVIRSAFDNNADFARTSPAILALAKLLDVDDATLNNLFIAADKLTL